MSSKGFAKIDGQRNQSYSPPAVSLPKGGGALKGIGETFQPNLFSGTGNYTIPVVLSSGRNGFGPALSLQYSSGNGNGAFGLGWQLSVPRISRKTEKGLPHYTDDDIFVMSGAEDLVPCLKKVTDSTNGQDAWVPEAAIHHPSHTVRRYRPRTEGLFARIERWRHDATGDTHWRAITGDNVTSVYGATPASRISNPANRQQVYEWLLQETFDAAGNRILYEYARDNPQLYAGEDPAQALNAIFERHRRPDQLYLRRVYYGNFPYPLLDEQGGLVTYADGREVGHSRGGRRYAFEVVFDYGDWDIATKNPHPDPLPEGVQELFGPDPSQSSEHNPVPIRGDRFSSFRAGFEIRTLRRCRRVLMFHHFAELGNPTLVRSTDFDYHDDPETRMSLLAAVTVTGYQKSAAGGDYKATGMPPVTFKYSEFRPQKQRYQPVAALGDDMPPLALDNPNLAIVDLFGDGLPDVLQSTAGGFRYWRNLGGGLLDRPRPMPQIPAGLALAQPGVGFGDMGGDGQADLLVHSGPLPGFFETTSAGTWRTFRPYDTAPTFAPGEPNVRLVDLTGDGLSDALVTDDNGFLWFQCLGEKGFAPPRRISRKHDLDQFPDLFFNDPAGRVRLADMTGDGLNDIVLLHNGRIDYWPNLGYGQFGRRVTMANAPRLQDDFDPRRLFLADLNGTGCADLVYVDFDRVHFWFNQSGNGWGATRTITGTPSVTNVGSVQFADVFGTGTTTLLWSYDYAGQSGSNYKALDFCGGVKPYVLTEMSNNMGATTRVSYAPSTRHYLEDLANGTPWITKLPFPVQVVDKVEVIDHLSKTKLVTTYKYHHGYFDGRERVFRGFGRVDQFDSETFEDFSGRGLHGDSELFDNGAAAYHAPPVETRSWFHTGVYFDEDATTAFGPFDYQDLADRFRGEFYGADEAAFVLDGHEVETGGTPHEAYRTLHGAILRTEVYAHDLSAQSEHPYIVTEGRYKVTQLQPKDGDQHAVYFSHPLEALSYHYERNPTDPRISHEQTLEVDAYGNVLKSVAIGYGRRQADESLPTQADRDKQTRTHITYSENSYTKAIDDPTIDADNHRMPLPCEARTYELTGFYPMGNAPRFRFDEWTENGFARLKLAGVIAYAETANFNDEQKRLIEHARTYYRSNNLSGLLPLGELESLALPGESYKLALTPGLLTQVYGDRVTDSMLADADQGGYVHSENDANWWIPSGRIFFSHGVSDTPAEELAFAQRHFFLPWRAHDPFGHPVFSKYDSYDLLQRETIDALGNRPVAEYDYRLLQPLRLTDPNGNRSEVAFDTLGLVVGTAVRGKTDEVGDSLTDFEPNLTPQQLQDFFADPLSHAAPLLKGATTRIVYDLDRFRAAQQPPYAATIARETHLSDPTPPSGLQTQVSFSYSDGFGRELQKKLRAERGPLVENGPAVSPRWVASGWAIFNNKGKPVRQYEPFFEETHEFRFGHRVGVSSTLFYDPLERVVATLHPNHTWGKILLGPWRQETWDVNDTVLIADPGADPDVGEFFRKLDEADYARTWHEQRQGAALGTEEEAAAAKAALHAATPSVAHADSLGRTFLAVAHNRFERGGALVDEKYDTRAVLDIEGNQREVVDALGRTVRRYAYDMLGTRIHRASMESGERWTLNNVAGNPLRTWDSRGHQFGVTYDELQRPLSSHLHEDAAAPLLIARTVYGESRPNPEANNLRGKVVQLCDQAGVVFSDEYDFKGNLLSSRRRLAVEYKGTLDWSADPALEPEGASFISSTAYDALNRPVAMKAPDGSICLPTFNEANLLEKIEVNLRGDEQPPTGFVTNILYDAKGQRVLIEYGNGVKTRYEYDPLTFRLSHLQTLRGDERLQDLFYTYDPAGNVTQIRDEAQQTLYFDNQAVTPGNDYTYDAVYRLVFAEGREQIGQNTFAFTPEGGNYRDYPFIGHRLHSNDGQAMRRYTEQYEYDAVGNFRKLIHRATNNGAWTRSYFYDEPSLLEPGKMSNRLSATAAGNDPAERFAYDAHGNMTDMPHLTMMRYDHRDQVSATARQAVSEGTPETTFYVYDGAGQRVRKVTERQNGTRRNERIYLGGFEVYREYGGGGNDVTLERETLHVTDDRQRIALVETRIANGGSQSPLIRYQFGDHLGSPSLELNGSGQIISYEEYHPYGTTSFQTTRSAAEVSLKRYRYAGQERDEETGFAYHTARYYAPWLGRWVSCDPLTPSVDGTNSYLFVRGNPVNRVDPNGRDSKSGPLLWVKVEDTTVAHDSDKAPHVSQQKYLQALESRLSWVRKQGIGLRVEAGLFTEGELNAHTPETRIQILLSDIGELNPGKSAVKFHEKNLSSLISTLLDLKALQGENPYVERNWQESLAVWPDASQLLQNRNGVTFKEAHVSVVEHFDFSRGGASDRVKTHPGEYEAQVMEHEFGHHFLTYPPPAHHPPKVKGEPNVMEMNRTPRESVHLTKSDLQGKPASHGRTAKKFLSWAEKNLPTLEFGMEFPKGELNLLFNGYPTFLPEDRAKIVEQIKAKWEGAKPNASRPRHVRRH
jgi:RHS repeat-associated protein